MATGDISTKEIQDTYRDVLLFKGIDNEGLTGTLKYLRDGIGNDSTLKLSTTEAKFTNTLEVTGVLTATGGIVGDVTGDIIGNVTGGLLGVATQAGQLYSSTSIIDDDYPVLIVPDYGASASGYYNMRHNDTITYNPTTEILKTKDIELTGNISATGGFTGLASEATKIKVSTSYAANRFSLVFSDDDVDTGITTGQKNLQDSLFASFLPATGELKSTSFLADGYMKSTQFKNGSNVTIYDTTSGNFTGDLIGNADTATSIASVSGMPQINYQEFYGRITAGIGDAEILTAGADVTGSNTCNSPNVQANWSAIAGDAEILNKPIVYSQNKHYMQWSMRWNTDANPGGTGTARRRWFTIDKTYGPNDMAWDSYSTGTNPPTAWYDSQIPGIVIPEDMTLVGYSLLGCITWASASDTGDLLLELKTNTNPLTWDGSSQSVPLTTIGTRQTMNWTHQCYHRMEETPLSLSMSKGDIILPYLARDAFLDDSSSRYVEGIFIIEYKVPLTG